MTSSCKWPIRLKLSGVIYQTKAYFVCFSSWFNVNVKCRRCKLSDKINMKYLLRIDCNKIDFSNLGCIFYLHHLDGNTNE